MAAWPSARERRRRARLLADPDVERWIRRLDKGATSTKDVWPRRLAAFCSQTKTSPGELVRMQPKLVVDLLDSFEAQERKKGRRGSYVAFTVKVVRSWLRHGGNELPRGLVKVKDADKVFEETALSQDLLRAVFNAASAREKVAVALMAMAGVRPMVLGNYLGDDGLRLSDFPELSIEDGQVRATKSPLRLVVRQELSKAGHVYTTFLGEEGAGYLRSYLESRLRGGERLGPGSAIIVPDRAKNPYIRTINIGDLVRHALRGAELPDRPYVLRTTFAQRLLMAETAGKVPHAFAQHWMGHTGDMTARYTVNRGSLPADLVEEMRAAYRRCEPYLSTVSTKSERDSVDAEFVKLILSQYLSDEELAKFDLSDREAALKVVQERQSRARHADAPTQQIVPESELPRYLSEGWRAIMPVNGSGFVVERSN